MSKNIAVVFDLDGVIVDTISPLYQIYLEILSGFKKQGSPQEFELLNGANLDEIAIHLAKQHDLPDQVDNFREQFANNFSRLYHRVELVPGVADLLQKLKGEGIQLSVASSASRDNIQTVLSKFQLTSYFDVIFSGDDVSRAKPHPDIYLLAKQFSECDEYFVVEDSGNGVRAALAAGLVTIHYNAQSDAVTNAPYCVDRLEKVADIVLKSQEIVMAKSSGIEIDGNHKAVSLAVDIEAKVEQIWREACKENSGLFNDKVATYLSHELTKDGVLKVNCAAAEYKRIYAGLSDKQIPSPKAIGVSAVLVDQSGKYLLGKRSVSMSEYGGYFEFVPSGGIPVNYMHSTGYIEQIKTELSEETGISLDLIADIQPLSLVYDRKDRVVDICLQVNLTQTLQTDQLLSDEYDEFVLLDFSALQRFIDEKAFIPTSKAIFYTLSH